MSMPGLQKQKHFFSCNITHARFFAVTCLLFVFSFCLLAQSKDELKKKKEQLRKDIEYTQQRLEETRQNKKGSLNQLVILNKKITIREELIATISDELRMLDNQIARTASGIASLEGEIKVLKKEYAQMIRHAYKNQNPYNRLMFVFAADDFNQAYKRLKYIQQYNTYRQKQRALIEKNQQNLAKRKKELEARKADRQSLLSSQERERLELGQEKEEQVSVLNTLQEKEKNLKEELRKKQRDEERLKKAIEDIIRREIAKARELAKKEKGGKEITKENVFTLTPEAQKLSADFENNRGRLPWPVEKGIVTGYFGPYSHPVLPNIKLNNNGIDISSAKGAIARAVFEGEVTGVVVIPGSYKAVIVRHGEYLSVYSNLEEVFVKMGERIITKQSLGLVHTDTKEAQTEIHLEIWKGETKLNPSLWLFPKQ